ncbi:MAG: penicillin-insensitive murein endopeptidase [Xanthomonadales bacterium]|nr:penicillin-insensitive murein endopeptidase [Xanthomonadales bacterium]
MKRYLLLAFLALFIVCSVELAASTCYGTTSNGALRNGCKLPGSGPNFSPYTSLGSALGRTWVHCDVAQVVSDAYAALSESHPDWRFVYAESGKAKGGEFEPHKTHQNGLSVDFMVPVLDTSGTSVPLPTSILNKFGYSIEFDSSGHVGDLRIDFEAIAAHLAAVREAANANDVGIWRVIFDPELQPRLQSTTSWRKIKDLQFSERRSWVRHDEHYHIDFDIRCRSLADLPE